VPSLLEVPIFDEKNESAFGLPPPFMGNSLGSGSKLFG